MHIATARQWRAHRMHTACRMSSENNFRLETTLLVSRGAATILNLQHNIYPSVSGGKDGAECAVCSLPNIELHFANKQTVRKSNLTFSKLQIKTVRRQKQQMHTRRNPTRQSAFGSETCEKIRKMWKSQSESESETMMTTTSDDDDHNFPAYLFIMKFSNENI